MDPVLGVPPLSTDIELYIEFVLVGLKGLAGVPAADPSCPYLGIEKFSTMGDNDLGSNVVLVGESMTPSNPSPAVSSSSGGGVGVRGGSGMGIDDAMIDVMDSDRSNARYPKPAY